MHHRLPTNPLTNVGQTQIIYAIHQQCDHPTEADSTTGQAAPRTSKHRRRRVHQSQLSNTSTCLESPPSFNHASSPRSQSASSAPSTLSCHVATPQRVHLTYPNPVKTYSGYERNEESCASRPGPPPLPPRHTRLGYVDRDMFADDLSETLTITYISSIADTERSAQAEINNGEESDYYWENVDDFDFLDESLAATLSGLTMSTSNFATQQDNVVQRPPAITPSMLALNLNLAESSAKLPFQSTGPFYVVTKGSDVGVFKDWGYVQHITQMRGSLQKGYKTLPEARFRYKCAVNLGIVERL